MTNTSILETMKPVIFEDQYSNQRPMKGLSLKVIIGMLVVGLIILAFSAQAAEQSNTSELKGAQSVSNQAFVAVNQLIYS